jgi:hypothetical protein
MGRRCRVCNQGHLPPATGRLCSRACQPHPGAFNEELETPPAILAVKRQLREISALFDKGQVKDAAELMKDAWVAMEGMDRAGQGGPRELPDEAWIGNPPVQVLIHGAIPERVIQVNFKRRGMINTLTYMTNRAEDTDTAVHVGILTNEDTD